MLIMSTQTEEFFENMQKFLPSTKKVYSESINKKYKYMPFFEFMNEDDAPVHIWSNYN